MPNPIGSATPASSSVFDGTRAPEPTEAGTLSCGSFSAQSFSSSSLLIEVLQGVPAPVRVILPAGSNPTVTKVGPQEYSVTLSLSGVNTVQLAPAMADAHQNQVAAVAPNVFAFTYQTRQRLVATVSPSGLVTAVARGSCIILIGSARQANLPFTNAAPPSGEVGCEVYAELQVTVRP